MTWKREMLIEICNGGAVAGHVVLTG